VRWRAIEICKTVARDDDIDITASAFFAAPIGRGVAIPDTHPFAEAELWYGIDHVVHNARQHTEYMFLI
jgi:hypothetical protein